MRLSTAYLPTQKEIPSDAVIPSHQLMIRAGLIKLLASGVYSYLPLGWRVMRHVMQIIREEMDRIGAQELYLPVLNPVEIWDETGRNEAFGDEMFRLQDRKRHGMVLAPTHEEIICDLARKFVRSYKDMPQIWYQIQTKFRDEPRPRSGVIRARQFFMKDAYSLTASEEDLNQCYDAHAEAYKRIFSRCGLKFHIVGASSGLMGGSSSQEFMLESEFGEDILVLCDHCGYAANLEVAVSRTDVPSDVESVDRPLEKVATPGKKTIDEVSEFLKSPAAQFIKTLIYYSGKTPVMALLRGDHELNEAKLQQVMGGEVRPAHPDEVRQLCGTDVGFLGPVEFGAEIRIIADESLRNSVNMISGANENDYHIRHISMARDVTDVQWRDIRNVREGESCSICHSELRIIHATELGHIFKLGTKYSESMQATFLDQNGKSHPIIMGSYGIGVERIIAAAIEQYSDDKGIVWPVSIAPFTVHLIALKMDNQEVSDLSEDLYSRLREAGIPVLFDDRKSSPGFKFKDADLIGIPLQVVIGEKGLAEDQLEIRFRKTGQVKLATRKTVFETILTTVHSLKSLETES